MKLHVTAIAAVLLIAVGDSAAATPSSQQLLAQAAAGGTSAHLFGLSPARDSTIPAERKEAAGAGHALNIINLFVDWNTSAATMTSRWKSASAGGAVPELTWMPCSFTAGCTPAHNPYPLRDIAAGTYDSYITSIADAAKAFGAPVIMRFAHEMNANWYPWGSVNGNTPAQYIAAWRHVVHIFNARGAANAEWLWTPNKHGPKSGGSCNLCAWYPGDSYVTFTGVDGYNGPQYSRVWTWPSQVFGTSFEQFPSFTTRPVIIGEVGSVEASSSYPCKGYALGDCKAQWITKFVSYLASNPYGVKPAGFTWSDFNSSKAIGASTAAQNAMKAALAQYWVSS